MIKKILIHSYLQLINNSKLTKLVLFTLFAYSLIFVFVLIYNTYFYAENEFDLNTSNEVISYIFNLFSFENIWWTVIALAIFLFFWYFVFGPIGEYAIVDYLHNNHKISKSLSTWFTNFHHIAKFEWMVFMFGIVVFLNILSKVYIYKINNGLVMSLMVVRLIIVLGVTFLSQYTKVIIIIEKISVFDAVKESIALSVEHWNTTAKLVIISLIFWLRLLFNLIFIVWIPVAAIIILQLFWVVWTLADVAIYLLFFSLLLFLAYINTLIEWYFRIYRYLAYLTIKGDTDKLAKLGVIPWAGIGWLFEAHHHSSHDEDELKLMGIE